MHIHTCTHTLINTDTDTNMHIHTCTHTLINTHPHTHTHTHTHIQPGTEEFGLRLDHFFIQLGINHRCKDKGRAPWRAGSGLGT